MFGVMHDSRKSTAPIYGFGSSDRANASKVFLTPEHAKTDYGKNSPGPVYDLKSSLGKQATSRNESMPLYSFGTADRFAKGAKSGKAAVPGPGAYQVPSSIGKQADSNKGTAPEYGLGTSTRAHQEKVFLSQDQAKINFGINSPGPSAYNCRSSVGEQANSKNESAPSWKFSKEERLRYDYVDRAAKLPGAGQYGHSVSCGPQAESKKSTLPKYSFGTCTRTRRHKVYISPEHEKSHFGENSPGPASIGPRSGIGPQSNSRNFSSSQWGFGTSSRLVYSMSTTPGPGTYDS